MDTFSVADTTDHDRHRPLATPSGSAVTTPAHPAPFETLKVRKEGAVLFADIAAPPMNLLGPALVRDLVSLIQQAEADNDLKVLVFKSADPDYFIPHVDVTKIKEYRQEAAKLIGEASIALLFRHHLLTNFAIRRKRASINHLEFWFPVFVSHVSLPSLEILIMHSLKFITPHQYHRLVLNEVERHSCLP
jgi:hypothetical protein